MGKDNKTKDKQRHVVFVSGGLGSWKAFRRVISKEGKENTYALFTDTLIEDIDLYRFLIDTLSLEYGVEAKESKELVKHIPETSIETQEDRKKYLDNLAKVAEREIPNLFWRNDGRDVWDIFFDDEMLGNSRLARCSHIIKQDLARDVVENYFDPEDTVLYLGIDWTEEHRTKAPKKNWSPYEVRFPMCEEPLETNIDHVKDLEALGVKVPRLYSLGFSHNNCGGFCVRAGQGHFINLLEQRPELYDYHEKMELLWREKTGKPYTILRKQRNKVRYNITLKELREEYEAKQREADIDFDDIGGCGCFVEYPEE